MASGPTPGKHSRQDSMGGEGGADTLLRTNKHTHTDTYINTYIPTRDLAHSPAPLFNIHSLPSTKKVHGKQAPANI